MFEGFSSICILESDNVEISSKRLDEGRIELHFDVRSKGRLTVKVTPNRDECRSLRIFLTLEDQAKANVSIASRCTNLEQFSCETVQKHLGRNSKSQVVVHCVAEDQSVINYIGKIDVPAKLNGVQTSQICRGLLTSDKAKIVAIPGMNVSSYDAECMHGVAIGGLDPELMMYFSSRGIDYTAAKKQYISGFLEI